MTEAIAQFIAAETGQTYVSERHLVEQDVISQFADCTQDWKFLHVDPEAAAATEFGGTIAHGFLVLSLLAALRMKTPPRQRIPGLRLGVNYGIEHLRWVQPVRSGSRIRGHFKVAEIIESGADVTGRSLT